MTTHHHTTPATYDVVICGGGLAGLSLARQLKLNGQDLSILVLDRLKRPLPEAAFKVGESTVELGAYYFFNNLGLLDHLETQHFRKLGLRFFYRGQSDFSTRPEMGVSRELPLKAFQIDRGRLENHLRDLVEVSGCELKEDVQIKDIHISRDDLHRVVFNQSGTLHSVQAKWVIDALGRRRFLQYKFALTTKTRGVFNSAWWRVKGKVTVNDFVPADNTDWHGRVVEDRWYSTTHMMGKGYWVWLIPLAPDVTSVGIVASDELQPFEQYNTYEKALNWLEKYEPCVANAMRGRTILDFLKRKDYSYTSKQIFSTDRWGCVGEAATFVDPYYSVGSNMIAFENGFIRRMIEMDRKGELTREYVEYANNYVLALDATLRDITQRAYPFLDNGPVMLLKTTWDYHVGWTTFDPQFYHEVYLEPEKTRAISVEMSRVAAAQVRILKLFEDWARMPKSNYSFKYFDQDAGLPMLRQLRLMSAPPRKDFSTLLNNMRTAAARIEELAHVIFFIAVRDVLPDKAPLFKDKPWLNVLGISLDPARWENDGLFRPKTKPRDITRLSQEIESAMTFSQTKPVDGELVSKAISI